MLELLVQDLRNAGRSFRRNPLFAIVATLTLGLGIGASTTIFSILDGVALSPLPCERPEEVVVLGTTWRTQPGVVAPEVGLMASAALSSTSAPNFVDWRARSTAFRGMAGARMVTGVWLGDGPPERIRIAYVSTNFFTILGVAPAVGRGFTPDDFRPDAPQVALATDGFWRRKFGTDSSAVGTALTALHEPFTLIGCCLSPFNLQKRCGWVVRTSGCQ